MLVTPSVTYPTSAPVALGGTTVAAQVTATRGIIAAQVSKGSAVYALLRWNTGLNRWETVRRNGAAVTVEPTIAAALCEASTEFAAIPASYYTALLTTSQPDGSAANLVGIAIQDAGVPASVPSVVALSPDVIGPSNANTVVAMQHNPIDSELLDGGDTGKALIWSGAEWAATALPGGGATPSDDPPLEIGTPDPGVSAEYSRGDHVHDLPEVADPGTTQYPALIEIDAKGRVLNLTTGSQPATSATSPINLTAGVISIDAASTLVSGSMSAADKTKLDNLPSALSLPVSVANGGLGNGTGSAAALNNIPAAELTGDVALARISTALGAGSATIAAKSISGSANTLTNIPNSALTNSSLTVSAGTGLTGGGAVSLGGSTSIGMPNTGPGAGSVAYPASITLDAQGRITAATPGSAPPAAITAASVTSSTSTNLTADDTWTDIIDLAFPLGNGTYQLQAEVSYFMNATVPQGIIQARIYNVTDAVEVTDTLRTCGSASVAAADVLGTTTIVKVPLVITGGPKTIRVQAQRLSGGTYGTSLINSDGTFGYSTFSYLKIA
jgi:hypothetical protein